MLAQEPTPPKRSKKSCFKLLSVNYLMLKMQPVVLVFFTVFRAQDLGLQFAGKEFRIEEFVPEPGVEALRVGVFPWRFGFDVERLEPM